MKWLLCFVVAGALVSCNVPKDGNEETIPTNKLEALTNLEKEETKKEDTAKIVEKVVEEKTDVENKNLRVAKTNKPLLIARGSEPGWYAEFFADHLRMLIDNGTDSVIVERDFSGINSDPMYNTPISKSANGSRERLAFTVSISNKKCIEEASGEKREKEITILYRSKQYKGCATANIK
jgi:uncharacterized membrane protein